MAVPRAAESGSLSAIRSDRAGRWTQAEGPHPHALAALTIANDLGPLGTDLRAFRSSPRTAGGRACGVSHGPVSRGCAPAPGGGSLLAARGDSEGTLSGRPARTGAANLDQSGPAPPSLTRGMRLGVFDVESFVGAGGMGEVYRAHDTRLDRHVALKVLSPDAASDPRGRAASRTRPVPSRASRIHTSVRCTRWATKMGSTSSSWSISKVKRWRRGCAKGRCRSRGPARPSRSPGRSPLRTHRVSFIAT